VLLFADIIPSINRVKDNEARIGVALSRDLGKPFHESVTGEIGWLLNDILFVNRNLKKWMKDETPKDVDLAWKFVKIKVRKDPLGCVLVMGCVRIRPFLSTAQLHSPSVSSHQC
jgi:acyl-CoA reductase-like NAD-dependent aldehyde dehydrogenase